MPSTIIRSSLYHVVRGLFVNVKPANKTYGQRPPVMRRRFVFTGAQTQGMSRSGTQWHAKARGRALFQNGRVRTRGHAWARVHSFSMVPKEYDPFDIVSYSVKSFALHEGLYSFEQLTRFFHEAVPGITLKFEDSSLAKLDAPAHIGRIRLNSSLHQILGIDKKDWIKGKYDGDRPVKIICPQVVLYLS